jgi:dihydrolipoamide dehydrogenase
MAKAKIEDDTDGFIKILYSPEYRELLGVHIVGGKATELIAEFVLGKILETTVDEIAHAIHPHPTFSETVMEAAHAAVGAAIHM